MCTRIYFSLLPLELNQQTKHKFQKVWRSFSHSIVTAAKYLSRLLSRSAFTTRRQGLDRWKLACLAAVAATRTKAAVELAVTEAVEANSAELRTQFEQVLQRVESQSSELQTRLSDEAEAAQLAHASGVARETALSRALADALLAARAAEGEAASLLAAAGASPDWARVMVPSHNQNKTNKIEI